jgi:hypothetical protein
MRPKTEASMLAPRLALRHHEIADEAKAVTRETIEWIG